MNSHEIALSFAGEDRAYVAMVADGLKHRGVTVFYDDYEKADMWGKNLYDHLVQIYQKTARYVVIFISSHYKEKVWTNHERRAAQARALNENYEYILPARFDDTEIEGILPTVGYLDLRRHSPEEVVLLLCEKLGRPVMSFKAHTVPSPRSPTSSGLVRFNYSNFNGRFRIGDGLYEFESKWTKASNTSIYCYTDAPSIRGVALAPRSSKLSDISDAAALDYTSRTRTPEIGRFVVLQNQNGFYAALEILEIADDTRGAPEDLLSFRYWILRDGSKDFSKIQVEQVVNG
jgi:hypothetical protein